MMTNRIRIGLGKAAGAVLAAWLCAGVPAPAFAQQVQMQEFNVRSGTGFIISNRGYIVTNEHVVKQCKTVRLRGAVEDQEAAVVAVDETNDLALVRTRAQVRHSATIRHPGASKLKLEEPVLVMGYPAASAKDGIYRIATSQITGLQGPTDEPHWIQFSDSVQQGNSGGPLLDSSGNVAGVVVGKAELYRQYGINGQKELVRKSDIAISVPVLMRFLDKHYIAYRFNGSFSYVSPGRVEKDAQRYIVNIQCLMPVSPASS